MEPTGRKRGRGMVRKDTDQERQPQKDTDKESNKKRAHRTEREKG